MNPAELVRVVLVEPQQSGNVGAAARAMANFGLSDLVLVRPPSYDPEQARWMAPGCSEMLGRLRIVDTLDEALEGCQHAVASTARHRRQDQAVLEPAQIAKQVLTPDSGRWAILFGREDHGLATADVLRCQSILRIATPEHASLNLGQAVLLVAHTLFEEARAQGHQAAGRTLGGSRGPRSTRSKRPRSSSDKPADVPTLEPVVQDIAELLDTVGYLRGVPRPKVEATARTSLQKGQLTHRQVAAMRGMLSRIRWALDNPELDWKAPKR